MAEMPASTVPREEEDADFLGKPYPRLKGRCPSCGNTTLFRGSHGYITCSLLTCKNPSAGHDALDDSYALHHGGIIEISVRNDSGSIREYMEHWESRAVKAEAKLAAIRGELDR